MTGLTQPLIASLKLFLPSLRKTTPLTKVKSSLSYQFQLFLIVPAFHLSLGQQPPKAAVPATAPRLEPCCRGHCRQCPGKRQVPHARRVFILGAIYGHNFDNLFLDSTLVKIKTQSCSFCFPNNPPVVWLQQTCKHDECPQRHSPSAARPAAGFCADGRMD